MTRQMLMVLFALLFGLLAQCERIYRADVSTDDDQVSAVWSNDSLAEDGPPPCVMPADARPAQADAQVALQSVSGGLPDFGPCARTFKAVWDAYAYGKVTVGAIVWVPEELARDFVPNADGKVLKRKTDDSDSEEEEGESEEEEGSVFDGVRNAADVVRNYVQGRPLVFGLVVRHRGGLIEVDDLGYDDQTNGVRFQVQKEFVRLTQLRFSEMLNFIHRQKCVRDYVRKLRASMRQAARVVHQALSHKLTSFATTGSVMLTISAGASWVGWSAIPGHAATFSGTVGVVVWPESVRGTAFLTACGGKGTARYSVGASVGVYVGFSRNCFAGPCASIGVSFSGANGLLLSAGHSVSGGATLSTPTGSITGFSFSFGWELAAQAVGSSWNPFKEELFGGSLALCNSWEVISRGTECYRPQCSAGIMTG